MINIIALVVLSAGYIAFGFMVGYSMARNKYKDNIINKDVLIGLLRDCASETWMATDSKKLEELLDEFLVKRKLK